MLDPAAGLASLLQAIVDTPSVSGEEDQLAAAVAAALNPYSHLEIDRRGNTIIARTKLGRPQRVIIAGHLDTVPAAGNLPSRREVRQGIEVLTGRGTVDMKGGLACQLALAAQLTSPKYDITWLFYDNEEVDADKNGLYRLVQADPAALQADFAILMEPTDALVEGGCQGSLRAIITTQGVAAHAARSWRGHNAIHDLAPVLTRLNSYTPVTVPVDGLDYREGLNAVAITGGIATNVIPDRASLQINYRFAPDKTVEQAEAWLRGYFTGYDLALVDRSPAARPGLDAPLAASLVTATGYPARPKYGWTDVARFASLGIPAVNFGPGDPNLAHSDDEHVALSQVEDCRRALAAWLTA